MKKNLNNRKALYLYVYILYNVFSNNYSDNDKYVVWVILFLIFGRPTSESKHILKVIYNFYLNNFDKNASDFIIK